MCTAIRSQPVEAAEVALEGPDGPRRVSTGAGDSGERRAHGRAVTLRDLDSLERIGRRLQVSERLSALGRVTAGVAHEVKNPLNSMRLWLENLKSSLPGDHEGQQAVRILDKEIDRLDRVVKTFLDFSRPVEIDLSESDLPSLLNEILDNARPAMAKAGVVLATQIPERFPGVRMDRRLIHQAVLNLILNGCDAMGAIRN